MSSLAAVEAKLEAESKAFQVLQKGLEIQTSRLLLFLTPLFKIELTQVIENRQRLESQQQENEQVNVVRIFIMLSVFQTLKYIYFSFRNSNI